MKNINCPICGGGAKFPEFQLGGFDIYTCAQCSFFFAPSAFDVKLDYSEVYNTPEYVANQINSIRVSDPSTFADIITYRPFFENVRHQAGMKLLDVGCGVGRFCQLAYRREWNVTGIDVSQKAIEIGKQYAPFPMHNLAPQEMVQRKERYDLLTAFEVLEHISEPVKFLSHCREILKPTGQLFCTVPNWDCGEVQDATGADLLPPIHLSFFTEEALQRLIQKAGFCVVASGVIWTDPFPNRPLSAMKWCARRLFRRSRLPLRLWLHARLG